MSSVLIYCVVAGIVGTGIGGALGAVFGHKGNNVTASVLALAGGVMLAVVFFDLIPESLHLCNQPIVVMLGMIWGIVAMELVNQLVKISESKVKVHVQILEHSLINKKNQQKKLKKSGLVLMLAIALHDIPEGLAIGASSQCDNVLGLTMAVIICLHNIPEGMAVSLPLVLGDVSKVKAFLLSILAGSMTVVGGIIGVLVGSVSGLFTAFFLAFAGGAMLQVTMCEMLPNSINFKSENTSFYWVMIGILIGFVVNIVL